LYEFSKGKNISKSRLSHQETAALAYAVLWLVVFGNTVIALDPPFNSVEVGHWDGYFGLYCDITSDGQYAYLPNWGGADGQTARIHFVDISDPANPFLANTFFLPPPNVFASAQDVKVGDGMLFVALESDPNDSAAIIDIRDPLNATLITTVSIAGLKFIHNLFYDNGFLYLADGSTPRVGIVDLTALDPDNPPASPITSPKWILNNVGSSVVHDITVVDGRLYAAGWNSGLWIYDVSDVANTIPTLLGSVGGSSTHSMWPTGDGRFVVTGEERGGGGIKVYKIIEGAGSLTLELRDSFAYGALEAFSVHNQIIVGNRLYNSWYEKGLQVFDINAFAGTLTLVATFDTSDSGLGNWGVYPFLGDEKILLSNGTEGLYIVDITVTTITVDPPSPAPAPHDIRKNRYISVDPRGASGENPDVHHISVTLDRSMVPGVQTGHGGSVWWANDPDANCISILGPTQPASEPNWAACPILHLTGCPIIPTTRYRIATVTDAVPTSADFVTETQLLPAENKWWGDCVGFFTGSEWTGPQGVTNFDDVNACLRTFINSAGINATHTSVTDIHPNRPDLGGVSVHPNKQVSIDDVFQFILAFQGDEYPGGDLAGCTDP